MIAFKHGRAVQYWTPRQFISVGAPSLITLWDKTKDNVQVKGVSALTTYPLYLNVRRLPGFDPKAVTSAVVPAKALIATATITSPVARAANTVAAVW